jgi:DNA polymerase-3 subunit beta
MKLAIGKAELQRGLARIQAIVEKRNSMPILANALLEATGPKGKGSLAIAATDLEVGIRGVHEADVKEAGGITVSARKLYDIVRELPEETVEIDAGDNAYVEIRCGRSRFSLAGAAAEEYPDLP